MPTGERLTASASAVAQGIGHAFNGNHETEIGRNYEADLERVKKIMVTGRGPRRTSPKQ
jgi:hypothetical protein